MKNIDYIKFVVSKVEAEFVGCSNSREYVKVITVLHSLKITDNILRDVYILSGIKKLRQLSAYLIFMIKKIEAGSINIDNFMENYSTDKNFLASYFQTYYDLEQITPDEFVTEEIDTKFIFEEENKSDEIPVYSLAESNFKVGDLDNELVTEEFRDTSINENYTDPGDAYMKLVEDEKNSESGEDSNSVFFTDISEDVFSLPGKDENSKKEFDDENIYSAESTEEKESVEPVAAGGNNVSVDENLNDNTHRVSIIDEPSETKESKEIEPTFEESKNLADFFEKLDEEPATPIEEVGHVTPVVVSNEAEDKTNLFSTAGDSSEPVIAAEIISDEVVSGTDETVVNEIDESEILQGLLPTLPEKVKTQEENDEPIIETDKELDKKLQEIEKETSEELLNSEFIKYEKFLYEKNKTLFGLLDDLILINESNDPDIEMRDAILEEIFVILDGLKKYSESMSFEVITGIYSSMMYCFDIKFKDVLLSKENISIFSKSLKGVEDLIKGNELMGFDIIISKLKLLEEELGKLLADRENFEKKKYDFGEEESNMIKEFKDSSEYDAYIILRDKITELEETFQIIASMKDKTYPFESIRKLSVTFALFREIVNISRILEMNKVAHLAEAGYIFVKFVQNYRIDPFKEEVSEVFKYLIYSFKLIYLDKPVKDFDTFVSFLNDPVKIFYPKK